MTFSQFITILRARWRCAIATVVAVVALVVGVGLARAPQYTASASVLIDIKSTDPIGGAALAGLPATAYMATQLDVAQSERVLLRALRALGVHQNPEIRTMWQEETLGKGDYDPWLAELVLKGLVVKPSRESNVMTVSYSSPDPQFSAAMANALVQAYIDTTLELKVEPARQYSGFFDERAKVMREALETAQTRLSKYQQAKGIIATDERLDVENGRLMELSTQLVALQAVAAESSGRQGQAGNADRLQEVLNSPLIAGLTAEASRQESRLTELEQRLGDKHPQVQELRANIAQLRSKIASATRSVTGSLSVNNSVNQTRLTQLQASLDEQRAKVLRLKGQRDEVAVLLRDVENAQRAYDAVLARANQTGMESQNTQTNVSKLKVAGVPAFPSSPKMSLVAAVSIVLGALLGIGLALVREFMDRRVRSEADVVEFLKQPLLVSLPRSARDDTRSRSRLGLMKARVVNSLPRAAASTAPRRLA